MTLRASLRMLAAAFALALTGSSGLVTAARADFSPFPPTNLVRAYFGRRLGWCVESLV